MPDRVSLGQVCRSPQHWSDFQKWKSGDLSSRFRHFFDEYSFQKSSYIQLENDPTSNRSKQKPVFPPSCNRISIPGEAQLLYSKATLYLSTSPPHPPGGRAPRYLARSASPNSNTPTNKPSTAYRHDRSLDINNPQRGVTCPAAWPPASEHRLSSAPPFLPSFLPRGVWQLPPCPCVLALVPDSLRHG